MSLFWMLVFLAIAYFAGRKLWTMWKYRDWPGPSLLLSVPILGHTWMLQPNMFDALDELHRKYGDAFLLDNGGFPTIIACDYENLNKALKQDHFNGSHVDEQSTMKHIFRKDLQGRIAGFMLGDNLEVWKEQRKFMTESLSEKGKLEEIIRVEANAFSDLVDKVANREPVCITKMIPPVINNVIWNLLTGKRNRQDDPMVLKLTNDLFHFFDFFSPASLLVVLQNYSITAAKLCQFFQLTNIIDAIAPIQTVVDKAINEGTPNEHGSLIDKYLLDIQEAKPMSSFFGLNGIQHLKEQVVDMFVAGTDTTSTHIDWLLINMIAYPDVQEKVFQEIEQIIGNREPCLDDQKIAYYTMAFIEESLRHWPMMTFPRRIDNDTVYCGMKVPKDTLISSYVCPVHMDPKHFPDPELFIPERHLGEDGLFKKNERLITFGLGKRRCPGDHLARYELFMILTSLVQKYKFVACSDKVDLKAIPSLTSKPRPYKLKIERRF